MENKNVHLLTVPSEIEAGNWNAKIEYLFQQQIETWPMARNHYAQFSQIERRKFQFDGFDLELQHNPARERSTFADVSKPAIENRPCFLCLNNLPNEQKGVPILGKYLILVNPFPIFNRHLTIIDTEHTVQQIGGRLTDLLTISRNLEGYTVFYNGPRCGASAPDHFHFQATLSNEMPINRQFDSIKISLGKLLVQADDIQITLIENFLRTTVVLESEYREPIDYFFDKLMKQLPMDNESGEPMVNLLASYIDGVYRLVVFPRIAQRPSCYFKEGDEKIVVSVASVELSGVIVTPREEDFKKITKADLETIFKEVSLKHTFTSLT